MEHLDNTTTKHSTLPSKRFFIRGGIAVVLVVLLLLIQTPWVSRLFTGKTRGLSVSPEATIGDVVGKDSNNNGIADWEEELWGLDPRVLATNGVANKTIIEQKRRSLQTDETGAPLSDTDRLARELFGLTTALGQAGLSAQTGLPLVGGHLGKTMPLPNTEPHYSREDIRLVTTSSKSLTTYRNGLNRALRNYTSTLPEIDVVVQTLETGNTAQIETLSKTVAFYQSLTSELLSLAAPKTIAQSHLTLTNASYGLAEAFKKMKVLDDDGINALVGLAEYRYFNTQLDESAQEITTFLSEYDIL